MTLKIETTIKDFTNNIRALLKILFGNNEDEKEKVIKVSVNANQIEQEQGLLDKLFVKLTNWSELVINLFDRVSNYVSPAFNSITEQTKNLTDSLTTTYDNLSGLSGGLDNLTSSIENYKTAIVNLAQNSPTVQGIQDSIFGFDPKDYSKEIQELSKDIKRNLLGYEVFPDAGSDPFDIKGSLESGFNVIKDNPMIAAGITGGLGLALVFPQATFEVLKLAGLGFGLAAVNLISGAFSRGLPVILTIAGYQLFIKDISTDIPKQEGVRNFFEGIVIDIKDIVVGTDSAGAAGVLNDLSIFLQKVGEGIIDGIFGTNLEFESKFAEAFVGALSFALGLSMIGFKPVKSFTTALASALFGASFVKAGKDLVMSSLKQIFKGLVIGEVFQIALESVGFEKEVADSYGKVLSGAFSAGSISTAVGTALGGPLVGLIAGIVGSFVGGITVALLDPAVRSVFFELGKQVYEGFKSAIFGDPKETAEALSKSIDKQEATQGTISLKQIELNDLENTLSFLKNSLKEVKSIEQSIDPDLQADTAKRLKGQSTVLETGISKIVEKILDLSDAINVLQNTLDPDNLDVSLPPARVPMSRRIGRKNLGGMITGEGGPKDDKIPHMLSNGEYVVQASAVKKFGPSFMDALNKGQMPQFKSGGGLAGSLPEITGGLSGGLSDSSLLALDKFDSFVKANDLQNTSLTQFFENNGLPSDQIPNVLEGMGLSHLADAPLGNPTTAIDIIDTTGIKTLSDVENYSRMTGVMESLKWAIDKPEEIFPKLGELLEHVGISVPEFPETAIEWPQFAWDSTKLIAQAGYKGLTYLAHQTQQRGTPLIKNIYHSRVKKDNLEPWINENVKEPFGLIDWDFELDKAIANGANEAILGAVYGGAFGSIKTYADLPIKFGKGVNRMGKGAWDLATGIGTFSPKKSAKGLGGLFGPMVGATRELYSLINRRRLFDQFMNTFKYGGIGATGFFFKGMLDHYIGNGLFNPTKIDKNLLPPHMQGEDLPPRMGPFDQRSAFERIKDKLSLKATPDGGGFDESKAILDSLPFNNESIEQISGYKRSAFQKQIDVYKNKIADRFENDEGGFFYDFGVSNPWSSMLTIGEGVSYPDDFGIPIPLMEMYTKKLEDTNSLYDFFTSYNIGLHETKHALDFLGMSIKNPGHWVKSGSTYEPGFYKGQLYSYYTDMMAMIDNKGDVLSGETRANLFAKDLSIAPPDVLNDSISKSHGSYILALHKTLDDDLMDKAVSIFGVDNYEDFIEKVINSKRQLTKEMPKNSVGRAIETGADAVNSMLFKNNSFISDYFDRKNGIKKYATGGYVTGEGGPTDDKIPAMLSNKEFVVNAKQTSKFRPILEAINNGMVAGFKGGMSTGSSEVTPFIASSGEPEVKGIKSLQKRFNELSEEILTLNKNLDMVKNNIGRADGNIDLLNMSFSAAIPLQNKLDAATSERTEVEKLLEQAAKGATKAVNGTATAIKGLTLSTREMALGATFAENMKTDFQTGFREALNTGDFMEIDLIDSFTTNWLNSFSQGFTDSLFGTMEKDKDGTYTSTGMMSQLQQLGGGAASFGGKASPMAKEGEEITSPLFAEGGLFSGMINSIKTGLGTILSGTGEGGGLGTLIGKIGPFFSGLGESLTQGLTKLFNPQGQGQGGAGGGMPSTGNPYVDIGMMILPFFMNNGGIVPSTPYSKAGVDSVPAMLTPGELVVPANKVKSYQDNTSKQQNVVNLSISGDVSRQTRQEIIKMLPTISAGVNATNKENNYKGR